MRKKNTSMVSNHTHSMTIQDFSKAQKALMTANVADMVTYTNPFANMKLAIQEEEKGNTMYAKQVDPRSDQQIARDYLIQSLDMEATRKDRAAREAFNLDVGHGLKTFGDLRKAIKEGWVTLDDEYKDVEDKQTLYENPRFLMKVQDPDKLPNREGYDAFRKEMLKAQSDVKDAIIVLGQEKGLEALNEFKAQTFH